MDRITTNPDDKDLEYYEYGGILTSLRDHILGFNVKLSTVDARMVINRFLFKKIYGIDIDTKDSGNLHSILPIVAHVKSVNPLDHTPYVDRCIEYSQFLILEYFGLDLDSYKAKSRIEQIQLTEASIAITEMKNKIMEEEAEKLRNGKKGKNK